jgi:hypothetical protein
MLDPELDAALERRAEAEGVSKAELLRRYAREWLTHSRTCMPTRCGSWSVSTTAPVTTAPPSTSTRSSTAVGRADLRRRLVLVRPPTAARPEPPVGASFVDATSFAVMGAMGTDRALAFDGDFTAAGFVELR